MPKKENRFLLNSQQEQLRALRLMGTSGARLAIPLLHTDHVRNAANVLMELAQVLDEIAGRKRQTNVNKMFDARVTVYGANQVLKSYADGDMKWLAGETDSRLDKW
mgnify:CR=1 FL=1